MSPTNLGTITCVATNGQSAIKLVSAAWLVVSLMIQTIDDDESGSGVNAYFSWILHASSVMVSFVYRVCALCWRSSVVRAKICFCLIHFM